MCRLLAMPRPTTRMSEFTISKDSNIRLTTGQTVRSAYKKTRVRLEEYGSPCPDDSLQSGGGGIPLLESLRQELKC